LAGIGQGEHMLPQDIALLSSLHSVPLHKWYPVRQVKPHLLPSQVASEAVGGVQGEQDVPHEVVLLLGTQFPPQSCEPDGQTPLHALSFPMQLPAHNFDPFGQVAPHLVPSHVALPPMGMGQALHDVPHVFGSLSLTHASPHL
jgi:hypothetical protein